MKKIANSAAILFIISVVILSIISILGIWEFFQNDVISKSFQSIGLLAIVAIIVMAADHFMDRAASGVTTSTLENTAVPAVVQDTLTFSTIRKITLIILIASAALLALFGIMSIWQVVASNILHKSLGSISIICFSAFIIVMTCLEMEHNPILRKKHFSLGTILILIILVWVFLVSMIS